MNKLLLLLLTLIFPLMGNLHVLPYASHEGCLKVLFVYQYFTDKRKSLWHYFSAPNPNIFVQKFKHQTADQIDIKQLPEPVFLCEKNAVQVYLLKIPYKEPSQIFHHNQHLELKGWCWVPISHLLAFTSETKSISPLNCIEPNCLEMLQSPQLHRALVEFLCTHSDSEDE